MYESSPIPKNRSNLSDDHTLFSHINPGSPEMQHRQENSKIQTSIVIEAFKKLYYISVKSSTIHTKEILRKMKVPFQEAENSGESTIRGLSTAEYLSISLSDAKELIKILQTSEITFAASAEFMNMLKD